MKPGPTSHLASMSVVEEYRGSRHQCEPCKRHSLGRTTGLAPSRPDTVFLRARTEQVFRQPFGPHIIPHATSSVPLSSRAAVVFGVTRPLPFFGVCERLEKSWRAR